MSTYVLKIDIVLLYAFRKLSCKNKNIARSVVFSTILR